MRYKLFLATVYLSIFVYGCHKLPGDGNNLSFNEIKNELETAKDGDTIIIPSGICILTTGIEINKSIVIKGAGIDKTVLKAASEKGAGYLLKSIKANNVRISGITFNMNDVTDVGGVYVYDEHHNFRIDHCKFTNVASSRIRNQGEGRPLKIEGYADGVIDHCEFLNNRFEEITVAGDLQEYNNAGTSWNRPIVLGGSDGVVFVENCSFTYEQAWLEHNYPSGHAIVSNDGSRYVFRYNTIDAGYVKNDSVNWVEAPIDAHGNYISGHRGSVSFEIYENTIKSVRSCYGMHLRGGTGVVFNNRFIGEFNVPINLTNYRSFSPPLSGEPVSVCTHFTPGVSECIIVDHGIDQINNVFVWGNTYAKNGTAVMPVAATVDDRGHATYHIKENVAFFNEQQPDGVLKSPWTSYTHKSYAPYSYPHPLTKEP